MPFWKTVGACLTAILIWEFIRSEEGKFTVGMVGSVLTAVVKEAAIPIAVFAAACWIVAKFQNTVVVGATAIALCFGVVWFFLFRGKAKGRS